MRKAHPAELSEAELLSDCRLERTRASGPGGQRRNKVETSVVLRHGPSGISTRATKSRSAEQNRREALRLLRLALAVGIRTEREGRSDLWRSRVAGGRIAVNPRHADLPALIAEALDVLAQHEWDGPPAATELGISTSQLVKLLGLHAPALVRWNEERAGRGLRPLRG